MTGKYPYTIKVNLPFSTGKKLETLTKSRGKSLSGVVRTIIEDYFERLPYRIHETPNPLPVKYNIKYLNYFMHNYNLKRRLAKIVNKK